MRWSSLPTLGTRSKLTLRMLCILVLAFIIDALIYEIGAKKHDFEITFSSVIVVNSIYFLKLEELRLKVRRSRVIGRPIFAFFLHIISIISVCIVASALVNLYHYSRRSENIDVSLGTKEIILSILAYSIVVSIVSIFGYIVVRGALRLAHFWRTDD